MILMTHQRVGVIGLGLLGRGIAACLLGHGHHVVAYTRTAGTRDAARAHIGHAMRELVERAGFPQELIDQWQGRYAEADGLTQMADCDFVIESIFEDREAKGETYDQIEQVLPPDVSIASNTSAIPISILQANRKHPNRFVGMHWAEPAHATRFLEVIKGAQTDDATFDAAAKLAFALGKEPSRSARSLRWCARISAASSPIGFATPCSAKRATCWMKASPMPRPSTVHSATTWAGGPPLPGLSDGWT
jgi:3-hydroxybutyryl-CoA dehydrogenase